MRQPGQQPTGQHAPVKKRTKASTAASSAGHTSTLRQNTATGQSSRVRQGTAAGRVGARKKRSLALPLGIAAGVILLLVLGFATFMLLKPGGNDADSATEGPTSETAQAAVEGSLSFCAVGKSMANGDILQSADAWSGTKGDGNYDFSPLFQNVSKIVSGYDVAFVTQGSTLGGSSEFEYQGYPSYNTPDSMAKAIADAGFDVVNCNTNHVYDTWVNSIEHSQSVWAEQKGVTTIGSYASEEDRANIRVLERNGVKLAFLSYCYGQNGYAQSDLPNDYYAPPFDKSKMREEVGRAQELADAVVVYMHWSETELNEGETDVHKISDEQQEYSSFLAGLGVDLVIGCHADAIQPVRYVGRGIRTTDGSGVTAQNGMTCVYGLGDFVSAYTVPTAVLSGMFTCDFVKDANGDVSIQNPTWHGLVEHRAGNEDSVYALTEYSSQLGSQNELLKKIEGGTDPYAWAQTETQNVLGDLITVEV